MTQVRGQILLTNKIAALKMSARWSGSLPGVSQFTSLMYLVSVIVTTEQHELQ